MWNKDEVAGKGKKLKGSIKDTVGEITGNKKLENEGEADRAEGEVQEGIGSARRKTGDAVKNLGKKIAGK